MSVQLAANAVTGAAVIAGIKARVAAAYSGTVRVVASPNPTGPDYVAQEGVTIRVPVAEPFGQAGAGRAGTPVTRRIAVYVVTESMVDEAGSDENAAYAHMTLEETVMNAVRDFPGGDLGQTKLGIRIIWIPGGAEIARATKQDPALLTSVLLFDVQYPAPFRVNRT